ncbi:hypothetical protein [Streptomyces chryseus]
MRSVVLTTGSVFVVRRGTWHKPSAAAPHLGAEPFTRTADGAGVSR